MAVAPLRSVLVMVPGELFVTIKFPSKNSTLVPVSKPTPRMLLPPPLVISVRRPVSDSVTNSRPSEYEPRRLDSPTLTRAGRTFIHRVLVRSKQSTGAVVGHVDEAVITDRQAIKGGCALSDARKAVAGLPQKDGCSGSPRREDGEAEEEERERLHGMVIAASRQRREGRTQGQGTDGGGIRPDVGVDTHRRHWRSRVQSYDHAGNGKLSAVLWRTVIRS